MDPTSYGSVVDRCEVGFLITVSLQIYQVIFQWKKWKSVKIWQNYGHESVASLCGPPCWVKSVSFYLEQLRRRCVQNLWVFGPHCVTSEMDMGWVHPWVGLGWVKKNVPSSISVSLTGLYKCILSCTLYEIFRCCTVRDCDCLWPWKVPQLQQCWDYTNTPQIIINVFTFINKKLSYRRRTARRAVSVKTMLSVSQMFVELHLTSPALGGWHSRSSKVIGNGTNR